MLILAYSKISDGNCSCPLCSKNHCLIKFVWNSAGILSCYSRKISLVVRACRCQKLANGTGNPWSYPSFPRLLCFIFPFRSRTCFPLTSRYLLTFWAGLSLLVPNDSLLTWEFPWFSLTYNLWVIWLQYRVTAWFSWYFNKRSICTRVKSELCLLFLIKV